MSDETLIDLDALEIGETLRAREAQRHLPYDADAVWRNLVCYAGLLLKDYQSFFSVTQITEYNNERAAFLLGELFPETLISATDAYLVAGTYWTDEELPDVCGACFRSFGLTSNGRYRQACASCEGNESKLAFVRQMDMHRQCPTNVGELVLVQLIYKYYSSNGDPLWQMRRTTNLP